MRTMSDFVPPDLLIEILTKVPVKSLLRFTCVCKSWYSLITNPIFITAHLNQTIANNKKNSRSLLLRHYSKNDKKEHYTLHHDDETFGDKFLELEFPFKSQLGFFRIVGSCNGLLCLCDDLFGDTHTIILWNPSIRKSVNLPMPSKPQWPNMFVLGFGVNPATNDYKVVRIVYYKEYLYRYKVPPEVEIYTLSTGSWRSVSSAAPSYCMVEFMWSQVFVNGAVHWIAYDLRVVGGFHSLIVSFDMGNEVFGEMMLPDALAGQHAINLSITVLEESLAVFKYDKQIGTESCCIWVMKEYGVAESWTRMVTIDLPGALGSTVEFRKNGEVLLSTRDNMLASYDPKTQQIKDLGIHGNSRSFYVDTYIESLFLLKGQNRFLEGQLYSHLTSEEKRMELISSSKEECC
uniref:F-box domain-containing protein n=1 Tax=Davidia involucrata TaxID=16924 RepID=A0A5B6ZAI8_DAVIN